MSNLDEAKRQYNTLLFVDALLEHILGEVNRVFWNVHQEEWDKYEDPQIPGIEYHPYYWGECDCEDEETTLHTPDCPTIQPNFKFEEVEIRWYKHPGRGQSCNVDWDERAWRLWFDRCVKAIQAADIEYA